MAWAPLAKGDRPHLAPRLSPGSDEASNHGRFGDRPLTSPSTLLPKHGPRRMASSTSRGLCGNGEAGDGWRIVKHLNRPPRARPRQTPLLRPPLTSCVVLRQSPLATSAPSASLRRSARAALAVTHSRSRRRRQSLRPRPRRRTCLATLPHSWIPRWTSRRPREHPLATTTIMIHSCTAARLTSGTSPPLPTALEAAAPARTHSAAPPSWLTAAERRSAAAARRSDASPTWRGAPVPWLRRGPEQAAGRPRRRPTAALNGAGATHHSLSGWTPLLDVPSPPPRAQRQ